MTRARSSGRPYDDTAFATFTQRVAEIEASVRNILDGPIAPDLSERLHARAAVRHIAALRRALAAGDAAEAADAALQLGAEAELLNAAPWVASDSQRKGGQNKSKAGLAPELRVALEDEYRRKGAAFKLTAARLAVARRFGISPKTVQRYTSDPRGRS